MRQTIIIGFDPGMSGGMAVLIDNEMQASKFESITEYNERLCDLKTFAENEKYHLKAFVEELTGITAGSRITPPNSFKLGRNAGQIEGLLVALQIPFENVRPQVWQKGLGVTGYKGDDKKKALKDIACRRYPTAKPTKATADAILIADYGRKQ